MSGAKSVKVGEYNYRLLSEIAREHGGTLKGHLENALGMYLGYVNETLAVKRPLSGKAELVNLEILLESGIDSVIGDYTPLYGEFSPKAVETFVKIIEKFVDRTEPMDVATIPPAEITRYRQEYIREHYRQWKEEFSPEKCLEYVMKGHSVNVRLEKGNVELTLKYATFFPDKP